jgi:hypothetical protein
MRFLKGLGHEIEFKYFDKMYNLGVLNNVFKGSLQYLLFLQYVFTLAAQNMATAIAHQRNI